MKKNYYLFMVLACFYANLTQAQQCPELIGNQSTTTTVVFKITAGTCNDYPQFIDITSTLFERLSCNGTNLKYTYISGPFLTSADTFPALFFPPGGICNYVNGELVSLSNNDVSLNESVSIFPNPLIKENLLTLKFANNISARIYMYDVTGKLAISEDVNNVNNKKINTSTLTNGIYFLQIATDNASITRKVIIMH